MHVIESDDYREEVYSLMLDPIIIGMVGEMPDWAKSSFAPDNWADVTAASSEYIRRGGKNARSIGGPAKAIARLIREGA